MGFCDITPQNVRNPCAILLGVNKNVDLMPLKFIIAGIDNWVLKRSSEAVFGRVILCSFKAYKLVELL